MNKKVKGVSWHSRDNIWQARIIINGESTHLGNFKNLEDAVAAREAAEIKYAVVPARPTPKLKNKDDLTQEMLKDRLHYNPETGDFTWRVNSGSRGKAGSIAGTLNKNGYRHIIINKKIYQAHRLAFLYMDGKFPEKGLDVDHINQIKNDNRWHNLRLVTHQENMRNCSMNKNNKSGCTGVYWLESVHKWVSKIRINKKLEHLGHFENLDDAIAARKQAEIKYNFHQNHGKVA